MCKNQAYYVLNQNVNEKKTHAVDISSHTRQYTTRAHCRQECGGICGFQRMWSSACDVTMVRGAISVWLKCDMNYVGTASTMILSQWPKLTLQVYCKGFKIIVSIRCVLLCVWVYMNAGNLLRGQYIMLDLLMPELQVVVSSLKCRELKLDPPEEQKSLSITEQSLVLYCKYQILYCTGDWCFLKVNYIYIYTHKLLVFNFV